jgi:hypothetical protein
MRFFNFGHMLVAEAIKKRVFWDVDPMQLDWDKDAQFIIERTLVRGDTADVRVLFKVYNKPQLTDAILKSRNVLTPKVANYMSHYLNIPYSQLHVAPEHY